MEKKKNILFILPSLAMGGKERQVVDLVNGLSEENFKVFLTTFEKNLDLLEYVNRDKVTFVHCPREYKFDFSVTKKIARVIDRENIDIIHWSNQIALLFGFFGKLRAKRKVKFIGAIHTTINRSFIAEIFDWFLYVPLMTFSKAIITVCENQRFHWSRKYPFLSRKFITIHNGINTERFKDVLSMNEKQRIKESLGIHDDEFTVAIVAGFRPEKGHEFALNALKNLIDIGKKIKLLLIGDGEKKTYLQSLAKKLSVSKNIIWLGWQQDPRRFISICDTFLLPSYAVETFSLAILEALSMGKPVISTDIGGTSEMVIDDINGYLIEPRDVKSIVNALQELIENESLRNKFSRNARESVVEKYTVSRMVDRTEELLNSIASACALGNSSTQQKN